MSNSPAFDASTKLISVGVLTASGAWPVKIGRLVDQPDAQVMISDTPGLSANAQWLLDYVTIGILVRGARDDYPGAWQKAKDVKDALLGMIPVIQTSGDRWDGVTEIGNGPSFLGYDDNSRPRFSLNFRIILEPATNALTSRDPLP